MCESLYCNPYAREEKHFNVGVPFQSFVEYYKEKNQFRECFWATFCGIFSQSANIGFFIHSINFCPLALLDCVDKYKNWYGSCLSKLLLNLNLLEPVTLHTPPIFSGHHKRIVNGVKKKLCKVFFAANIQKTHHIIKIYTKY